MKKYFCHILIILCILIAAETSKAAPVFNIELMPSQDSYDYAIQTTDYIYLYSDMDILRINIKNYENKHYIMPGFERLRQLVVNIKPDFIESDGGIWFSGIDNLYMLKDESFILAESNPHIVFCKDSLHRIWTTYRDQPNSIRIFENGILVKVIDSTNGLINGSNISGIITDYDGITWASGFIKNNPYFANNSGVIYKIANDKVARTWTAGNGLDINCGNLFIGKNNTIFCLCNNSLEMMAQDSLWHVIDLFYSQSGENFEAVYALADKSGNIWLNGAIPSVGSAVVKLNMSEHDTVFFAKSEGPACRSHIYQIILDGEDNLWALTDSSVSKFIDGSWVIGIEENNDNFDYLSRTLDGMLYFSSSSILRKNISGSWFTFSKINSFPDLTMTKLRFDRNWNLWIGSYVPLYSDGLSEYDGISWNYNKYLDSTLNLSINDFNFDRNNELYLVMHDGIYKPIGTNFQKYYKMDSLEENRDYKSFAIDCNNNLWVETVAWDPDDPDHYGYFELLKMTPNEIWTKEVSFLPGERKYNTSGIGQYIGNLAVDGQNRVWGVFPYKTDTSYIVKIYHSTEDKWDSIPVPNSFNTPRQFSIKGPVNDQYGNVWIGYQWDPYGKGSTSSVIGQFSDNQWNLMTDNDRLKVLINETSINNIAAYKNTVWFAIDDGILIYDYKTDLFYQILNHTVTSGNRISISEVVINPNGYIFASSNYGIFKIGTSELIDGVMENKNSTTVIKVFPNPCSDFVTIEFDKNMMPESARISDLTGSTLITTENTDNPIDIHSLVSGTYFVSLTMTNGIIISKSFTVTK